MISRPWTQRIGLILACLALLSFLASQIPAPASPQVLLAEQNGYNVFSVVQTFAAGITLTGMADVTTGDASTTAHGWLPKLSGSTSQFLRGDGTFAAAPTGSTNVKCINIDPTSTTTNWLFFRTEAAITLTAIDCLTDVATSTASITLQECDANGANCGNSETAISCSTTDSTESGALSDAAVDAGDWMRVTRGAIANSPTQVSVCVVYTEP